MQNALAPAKYRKALASVRRTDLTPDLARVQARTLIVCGTRDPLNRAAARAAHQGIAGSRLRYLPGRGQLWTHKHPALFAELLREATGATTK